MNSSTGDNLDYVGETISEHSRIIFVILGIFYVIVGVAGNIFTIVTILTTKSMHNPHYYFIANLALADMVIIGYLLPLKVITFILRYYPVVDFNNCVFNGFLTVTAYVSSLLSLLAISINRYLNVCHHDLFKRIFSRKIMSSLIGCGLIWLISILCTLPCLLGWGRIVFDRKVHYCGYDRTYSFSYTLFLLLISIGVPVVLVFACNFAIWRFVRQASHRIHASKRGQSQAWNTQTQGGATQKQGITTSWYNKHSENAVSSTTIDSNFDVSGSDYRKSGPSQPPQKLLHITHNLSTPSVFVTQSLPDIKNKVTRNLPRLERLEDLPHLEEEGNASNRMNRPLITKDELALIKTVFVVFICFAVLMSPYMISTLVDTDDQWSPILHISASFTSYTNCCLNCVIYGLMTPKFKAAFRALFLCRPKEERTISSRAD